MTEQPDRKIGVSEYGGMKITRTPDGNIAVDTGEPIRARIPRKGDFDENLAAYMSAPERKLLAMRLIEFCAADIESRADWENREKVALGILGIKDTTPESSDDEQLGGHDTTHPGLMEANVRFQANAIVELFPPAGPAETKILGLEDAAKMARAKRVRTFMNHYLTDVDKGYFADTDQMCMYLPMGGSAFRRASQDFTTGLPVLRYVKATNFIAPYAGTDLKSMPRYAWAFTMTGEDIEDAQRIGMFLDIYLPAPNLGEARHAQAADISDQRVANQHERDKLYSMLEYHVDLQLACDPLGDGAERLPAGDTGRRPYLVVVDKSTPDVLMVRRNWRKRDADHKKRVLFAHHKFLPGLGFYGWGYTHVIGSAALAANGSVNSLLDAALAANFQGGFVSKEAKIAGEFRLEFGVWKQCDSTGEDLQKSFFTPPFREPSPALFQLLDRMVASIQRFTGTTDAAVGDGNNTGPVGTTVALIDQAQKPTNAIHKRLHESMSEELALLAELMEDFMPDKYDYQIGDEDQFLLRTDFAPGVGVVCVTDPAISSDTQRVMRAQATMELQKQDPDLYPPAHRAEAHRRMLVALKVPNVDAVGPVVKQPPYLDAVGENANIFAGHPVQVFPAQDDRAHIAIHQDGIARAQALYPPDVFEKTILPAMQAHIRDHYAKAYYKQVMQAAGLPPSFDADGNPSAESPEAEAQITSRVAGLIDHLPKPQPKPGTPSAEQQEAQAKIQMLQQTNQAQIDAKEQAFQADEQRKQIAFDNEERRKDQALNNQEARVDITAASAQVRTAAVAQQDIRHREAGHVQDLVQGAQEHDQQVSHALDSHGVKTGVLVHAHQQQMERDAELHAANLEQGGESHEQDMEHAMEDHGQSLEAAAQSHAQGMEQVEAAHDASLEQSGDAHAQSMQQADELAKAASAEETESDEHQKF